MQIKTIAENRKDVVTAISETIHQRAVYLGPPTFAYRIGDFTVDREGTVEISDDKSGKLIKKMLQEKEMVKADIQTMEIAIPITNHTGKSLKNLLFMLHSKQYLINRAAEMQVFQIDEKLITKLLETEPESTEEFLQFLFLNGGNEVNEGIYFTDDNIVIDGFPMDEEAKRIKAYAELAALMCSSAISHKRVNPKETIVENEKYYMRVWLLRLGLGGEGGKETRKILLRNLKGHTAFRTKEEKEKAKKKAGAKKSNSED